MKNEIEKIDQMVKETLTQEESLLYDSFAEQGVFEMFVGLFKGKNSWINVLLNICILIFFVLFIYSCIQFFDAESTEDLVKWGMGSMIFILCISMLKLYAWMEMDKYAILREMKRIELQLMSLSRKYQK